MEVFEGPAARDPPDGRPALHEVDIPLNAVTVSRRHARPSRRAASNGGEPGPEPQVAGMWERARPVSRLLWCDTGRSRDGRDSYGSLWHVRHDRGHPQEAMADRAAGTAFAPERKEMP